MSEHFPAGHEILTEGQPLYSNQGGANLYIIDGGVAEVFKNGGKKVNTLRAGDLFGELGLVYGLPRQASVVVASEELSTWALDAEVFDRYIGSNDAILEDDAASAVYYKVCCIPTYRAYAGVVSSLYSLVVSGILFFEQHDLGESTITVVVHTIITSSRHPRAARHDDPACRCQLTKFVPAKTVAVSSCVLLATFGIGAQMQIIVMDLDTTV